MKLTTSLKKANILFGFFVLFIVLFMAALTSSRSEPNPPLDFESQSYHHIPNFDYIPRYDDDVLRVYWNDYSPAKLYEIQYIVTFEDGTEMLSNPLCFGFINGTTRVNYGTLFFEAESMYLPFQNQNSTYTFFIRAHYLENNTVRNYYICTLYPEAGKLEMFIILVKIDLSLIMSLNLNGSDDSVFRSSDINTVSEQTSSISPTEHKSSSNNSSSPVVYEVEFFVFACILGFLVVCVGVVMQLPLKPKKSLVGERKNGFADYIAENKILKISKTQIKNFVAHQCSNLSPKEKVVLKTNLMMDYL